jgi:opacity protein-like surface antigen
MKKYIAYMATVIALILPVASQAYDGIYVGGQVGVNFLDVNERHFSTDAGYTVGIVGGYKFCSNFRAEAEISYRHNDFKYKFHESFGSASLHGHFSGEVRTWSFMANGYYDLPVCWIVTPYVGAGIGYDTLRASGHGRVHANAEGGSISKSEHFRDTEDGFAWQVMAGVSYDLCNYCEDLELNAEYKYHHGKEHANDHAVTVGIRKFF